MTVAGRAAVAVLVAALVLPAGACGTDGPRGPRDVLSSADRAGLGSGSGTPPLVVAVLDGGIDATHPALAGRVVGAWRARGLTGGRSVHGTQVAGIVAGAPTSRYAGGLAPAARLLDVQVLDAQGRGSAADLAAGLRSARQSGADVVLTSLALEVDEPAVRREVKTLTRGGAVLVAASGNSFTDAPAYPAAYPGVLAVAALDGRGDRLQLSGWAGAVVAVPGEDVWAPVPGDGYAAMTGTSAAAAVAAGLVAACSDHQPLADQQLRASWTSGRVTDAGRARPRLTCPGDDDEGGR